MSIVKRRDCNFNLKNVKFREGQTYYVMKLSYHEGFGKLNRFHDLFDRNIMSIHHYYILIDTLDTNNKKCYTSLGLVKGGKTSLKSKGFTEIQTPDVHVSVCAHLLNKNSDSFFKNLPCLPNKNNYLRGNKRFWGKKIGEGKLNKFQLKILNYFINNAVKEKYGYKAPLPFKFAFLSRFCNLNLPSNKVNYFNCQNFARKFHTKPKRLYDDIIKYSKNINFDKIIDPKTGKIHNLKSKKGKQIMNNYETYINNNN